MPAPRTAVHDPAAPTWGWALVEIRADGTWGEPQVIPAPGTVAPPLAESRTSASSSITELSELLKTHLVAERVEDADRGDVAAVLAQGADAANPGSRSRFLGPLAHVEALQGDLRRSARHAEQVLADGADPEGSPGREHALLAQAWVALERADFDAAGRILDDLDVVVHGPDAWLATSHALLEAKLSIALGSPEAAIRLMAVRERAVPASGWLFELETVVRAEALIASGEPRRAMALLTPVPQHAVVEAMVTVALARRAVGDVRGALAVLSRAVTDLDHAPLALQVEAWLLEARMAEDQQRPERARLLVDRALRSAASEGMRRAVMRDWAWLRRTVDRDPGLLRAHRGFLATCAVDDGGISRAAPVAPTPGLVADELRPSLLTERESQVLGLLAQMNSTEEIAATLFVSTNTVKTHLKGIFGKLGVNRRVDAVRRGRSLGLC
ncbi:LuxR C-terminal-related transcriptional regulator [Nocardioides sp. STR2]|uniref:LuxR C-terminal-related transcriptional regulator n=1 Tax=Nocardioides pini TaxID=2975053 RepID=A0ABT4CEN2_9ACTN|nr:LuxR C-terminal-related transcriptional regulator [Nocardioides pini]MCY4727432.1 LuxR C-terminal-related transcriptional regulator [Nocardioides pini]